MELNDKQLNKKIDDLIAYYRSCLTAINNGLSDVDNNDKRNLFNTSKRYLANGPINDALRNQLSNDLQSFFDTDNDGNSIYDLTDSQVNIILDSIAWAKVNF